MMVGERRRAFWRNPAFGHNRMERMGLAAHALASFAHFLHAQLMRNFR
jgi:hypothetical protein